MAGSYPATRGLDRTLIVSGLALAFLTVSIAGSDYLAPAATAQTDEECSSFLCSGGSPPPTEGSAGRFTGQAVLMDKSGKVADSERGSSCPGCEWRIEDADCFGEECRILACPNDDGTTSPLQAVSVRTPDTDWRVAGYLCLEDEDDVVTTADIGEQVRQDWEALVPELRPTVQPPNGRTIVNLPTFFHSGQPERMPSTTVPVFDFQIDLTARGEWTWRFEPGVARTFTVLEATGTTPGRNLFNTPTPRRATERSYSTSTGGAASPSTGTAHTTSRHRPLRGPTHFA